MGAVPSALGECQRVERRLSGGLHARDPLRLRPEVRVHVADVAADRQASGGRVAGHFFPSALSRVEQGRSFHERWRGSRATRRRRRRRMGLETWQKIFCPSSLSWSAGRYTCSRRDAGTGIDRWVASFVSTDDARGQGKRASFCLLQGTHCVSLHAWWCCGPRTSLPSSFDLRKKARQRRLVQGTETSQRMYTRSLHIKRKRLFSRGTHLSLPLRSSSSLSRALSLSQCMHFRRTRETRQSSRHLSVFLPIAPHISFTRGISVVQICFFRSVCLSVCVWVFVW